MALKIWLNGSMHDLSKSTSNRLFTFVSGTKKSIPKGVTFVNGEKKILWQTGEMGFDSWTPAQLGFPYSWDIYSRIYGVFADESKVIYNVDDYISRANVMNISSPYVENTVNNGMVCYHKEGVVNNINTYDAYIYDIQTITTPRINPATGGIYNVNSWVEYLTNNKVEINQQDMSITASTIETSQKAHDGAVVNPYRHTYPCLINDTGNGAVLISNQFIAGSGYRIYKNYKVDSSTLVASVSSNGYNSNNKALLLASALYNNRYVLFGAEYQNTVNDSIVYSLKKVDLNTGTVTTLLDNYSSPVTGILIDNSDILVTVGSTLVKMDIDGVIDSTYTSQNVMPTIVGKYGNYYYLTTTRDNNGRSYMNIEIVPVDDFTTSEVRQTDVPMVYTFGLPYVSTNGYLCFATQHYVASDVYGSVTTDSGRTATMRSGTTGVSWTETDVHICRIRCY